MKLLVTGANGQLGLSLKRILDDDKEIEAVFTDVADLDITDYEAVDAFMTSGKFDVVVNCAAYTAVDRAESDDLLAARINTEAVGNIARAASCLGARVVHISTDYVFSGENSRPYVENDVPDPRSIYGRTKLEGEGILTSICPDAVIIRTAWLYSEFGNNFAKTMLRIADEGKPIRVVADQVGTPTYAGDLAEAIHSILHAPQWLPGIYHFTDEGVASWYDFAMAIFRLAGVDADVAPVTTREYPTPARRPQYSVLSKVKIKKTFNFRIPYWQNSLAKCLKSMK